MQNMQKLLNEAYQLHRNGHILEAANLYRQVLAINPKDANIQTNLGNICLQLGEFGEAATYFRALVKNRLLDNETIQHSKQALCHALEQLGNHAQTIGNYTQAEICYQEALQYSPRNAVYHYNLGNAQRELGKSKEAANNYQLAILIDATDADFHNNLGNVQRELGQVDASIASYKLALRLNPMLYHAKAHLVHQQQHICEWQNLLPQINEIREWVTKVPSAQISPFAFLAMPGTTAEEQQQCTLNWVNNRFQPFIKLKQNLNFSDSKKPKTILKIGYFSADFRLHPLAFLITELIELHDRTQFEIVAYSYGTNDQSSARKRLEQAFDHFYDVQLLTEIDIAKKINADGIDILIDLTGFTQSSRSGLLALRPAPVQINWLGYPGLMSADLYDYMLTDAFISPPTQLLTSQSKYPTEKLAIMPNCYQPNDCYRPVGELTKRSDNQLPDDAFVFCCFNQSFKILPEVFSSWMRLLHQIPNSVLWLLQCNIWANANLITEAKKHGIAAERLIFAPRTSIDQHLARHPCADLFLDTLPYNAHTTASDALWMGLPVLTCVGETFPSRVAGSLLTAAGLPELITYSLSEYEAKALALATNPELLNQLKNKLINQVKNSALFDTKLFTANLEKTLINLM